VLWHSELEASGRGTTTSAHNPTRQLAAGKVGSPRSISIAPPQAGRGTDRPRRGVPLIRQGGKLLGRNRLRVGFMKARRVVHAKGLHSLCQSNWIALELIQQLIRGLRQSEF